MPGGDRTGPLGAGPRTGRVAGYCAGYGMPGYANPYMGRGLGYGWGFGGGFRRGFGRGFRGRGWFGRGWGYGAPYWGGEPYAHPYGEPYYPPQSTANDVEELRAQEEYYSTMIKDIQDRIESLERKVSSQTKK